MEDDVSWLCLHCIVNTSAVMLCIVVMNCNTYLDMFTSIKLLVKLNLCFIFHQVITCRLTIKKLSPVQCSVNKITYVYTSHRTNHLKFINNICRLCKDVITNLHNKYVYSTLSLRANGII